MGRRRVREQSLAHTLAAVTLTAAFVAGGTLILPPTSGAERADDLALEAAPAPQDIVTPVVRLYRTTALRARSPLEMVCKTKKRDQPIRVINYNIKAGILGGGLGSIASLIDDSGADIVLLQEVDMNMGRTGRVDSVAYFEDRLGMEGAFGPNLVFAGNQSYGTAVLSRFPIVSVENTPLPNSGGGEKRGLLKVVVRMYDEEVSIYNTHLQVGSPWAGLRRVQMGVVAGILRDDPNRKILGGDFNALPSAPEVAIANSVLDDTWLEVGVGNGNTVPATTRRARIDFLMHSDGIDPKRAEVLTARLSDHLAVQADYVVTGLKAEKCRPLYLS